MKNTINLEYNENITADNTFVIEDTDLEIYTNYTLMELYDQALERHRLMKRLGPDARTVLQNAQEQRTALGATEYMVTAAESAKLRTAIQNSMGQGPMGSKVVTNPDETVMAVTSDQLYKIDYSSYKTTSYKQTSYKTRTFGKHEW